MNHVTTSREPCNGTSILYSSLSCFIRVTLIFFSLFCWSTYYLSQQSLLRTLVPLGDRILVRRAAKEVQTASGIYLPTNNAKDPNEGEVLAVGPGERDVTGNLHNVNLTVGDKVLLPEYGGMKIMIEEDEMFLFREADILGKFE